MDLIDRQAAIDALKIAYWDEYIQSAKDDPCIIDALTDWAIRQIKALPSAQPTQTNTHNALKSLDCISRQAAIEAITGLPNCPNGFSDTYDKARIISELEEVPTIDAVEIVRCCNCKWLQCNMSPDGQIPKGVDEYECRHWCGSIDPTDYCSAGERREP